MEAIHLSGRSQLPAPSSDPFLLGHVFPISGIAMEPSGPCSVWDLLVIGQSSCRSWQPRPILNVAATAGVQHMQAQSCRNQSSGAASDR